MSSRRGTVFGIIGKINFLWIVNKVNATRCGFFFLGNLLVCGNLSRVTFGESSSLKLTGKEAFSRSDVVEIHIPDGVEELCESCFYNCENHFLTICTISVV